MWEASYIDGAAGVTSGDRTVVGKGYVICMSPCPLSSCQPPHLHDDPHSLPVALIPHVGDAVERFALNQLRDALNYVCLLGPRGAGAEMLNYNNVLSINTSIPVPLSSPRRGPLTLLVWYGTSVITIV